MMLRERKDLTNEKQQTWDENRDCVGYARWKERMRITKQRVKGRVPVSQQDRQWMRLRASYTMTSYTIRHGLAN